jgi:hypothetical protein
VVLGKDGKGTVPHSWRIAILPYLGYQKLYDEYHFDEPWDSEHNKTLLAKMPAEFRSPADESDSTCASYFAVTGPGTAFADPAGAKLSEMTDGTEHVVLLVEAKRKIPWTKPEDIVVASDKPLPKLGEWFAEGWHAGFANGQVKLLSIDNDETTIRRLFTMSDGNAVSLKSLSVLPAPEPE